MTTLKEDFNTAAKPEPGALQKAIINKNISVDQIRKLLEDGANIEERNNTSHTPLMRALLFKRVDVMRLLIDKKANVNARLDNTCRTALMLASLCSDSAGMVQLLIDSGADIDAKDYKGLTALDHAKKYHRQDVVDILEGIIEARAMTAADEKAQACHTIAEASQQQIKALSLKRKKAAIMRKSGV